MGEDALSLARLFSGFLATRAASESIAGESIAYRIGNAIMSEMQKKGIHIDRSNADEVARAAADMVAFVLDIGRDVQAAVDRLVEVARKRDFVKGVYLVTSGSPPASAVIMLPVPEDKWLEATEMLGDWASDLPQSGPGVAELVQNARVMTLAEWEKERERNQILPLWQPAKNTCER